MFFPCSISLLPSFRRSSVQHFQAVAQTECKATTMSLLFKCSKSQTKLKNSFTPRGKIWTQLIDFVPNVWLHSSVGRSSHRYRRGQVRIPLKNRFFSLRLLLSNSLSYFAWNCFTIKLFLKLSVINTHDMNIKRNAIQNGVTVLVYTYWLCVKNSNYLHAEFSLGYLGDAKFYLESKVSFIDKAVLLHLSCFWLLGCRNIYCTFSDSSVVSLKSSPWPKYTQLGTIFHVSLSKSFSSSNMFFIRRFLANTWKNIGRHRARLREKENLFRYRAKFKGNLLRFVHALAHVRALMTRKSCAVGMRNAILRDYLKLEN